MQKEFNTDDKKYYKVRDHCHYTGKYRTSKEIPPIFHNGSKYDYHFIIKKLTKEFKGQFECLGEHKKELKNAKNIAYKIKLIDSFRFMSSSSSSLIDNLAE